MNPNIRAVIQHFKSSIEENSQESWGAFYEQLINYDYVSSLPFNLKGSAPSAGELTDAFLEAGIDPARILGYLPEEYLCGSKLDFYHIPSSVHYIYPHAFSQSSLSKITIPSTVTDIAASACYRANHVEEVIIEDGGNLKIKPYTFSSCTKLKTVFLPSDLQSLDYKAFLDCPNLATVKFQGTKDEWKALVQRSKTPAALGNPPLINIPYIICIDGEIELK